MNAILFSAREFVSGAGGIQRAAGMRGLFAGLLCLAWSSGNAADPAAGAAPAPRDPGERIYQEGILPSGAPLSGVRFGNTRIEGRQAACVNCHRRSGMGAVEGETLVEPITGKALFGTDGKVVATMDTRTNKSFNQAHQPYTDETIARLLREGINSNGEPANAMMPRYQLGADDQKALTTYLRRLSSEPSPGVTDDTIHFATVLTPGLAPERRQAFLDMLHAVIVQKNASTVPGTQRGGARRHMVSAAEMVLGTERKWALDVWELQGSPESWTAQLGEHYRKQPVFAILSGLANDTWAPVEAFCEQERVPCWFPIVPAAPASDSRFYSLYFSRGAALEADVLAKYIQQGKARPHRIVQIVRDQPAALAGAAALTEALKKTKITASQTVVTDADSLAAALKNTAKGDALMLWFTPSDFALLEAQPAPTGPTYFSGVLLQDRFDAIPSAWRDQARLVYPYELPEKRRVAMSYFENWLKLKKLPLVDAPMQAELFFAVDFMTDTIAEMLDNLYRDYLVERAETMLSNREAAKSEQRVRDRQMWGIGKTGESSGPSTTIYPHLGLGIGQHFASKGAYIVRLGKEGDLSAASPWIVP